MICSLHNSHHNSQSTIFFDTSQSPRTSLGDRLASSVQGNIRASKYNLQSNLWKILEHSAIRILRFAGPLACSIFLLSGTPTVSAATPVALANPTFADHSGDQMPDGWEAYPAGAGLRTDAALGGVRIHDSSASAGLGLVQWVNAEPGNRYQLSFDLAGDGGLFVYLNFLPKKSAREKDVEKLSLKQKRVWMKGGGERSLTQTMSEIAPAGTSHMRIWIYSPSKGTTKVRATGIRLESERSAQPETSASDAAALAAGLVDWFDFETGDFSQVSSKEGATRAIVKRDEGPVREGDHAYQATLLKSKERSEIVGARSPAYGVARYGWSIFVPENFDADTFFTIVTQGHDWGTGKEYPEDGGPPTHLYISKGKWRLKLRHQGDGATTAAEQFDLGSIEEDRGQWTDWVMEINHQAPGKGGWIKLSKNDQLVADYEGATWYEGKNKGPYFKIGLYRGSNKWPGTEERSVLYFDAFRMAIGEDSTYEQVAPSTYSKRAD